MEKYLHWICTSATVLTLAAFQVAAQASEPGFYVAGLLGHSSLNYNATKAGLTSTQTISKTGLGGRFHMGYQFDSNWAVEVGYTAFRRAAFENMNGGATDGKITQKAIDLTGKAILPFDNGFDVYAVLGVSRVNASPDASLAALSTLFTADDNKNTFNFGLGAQYEFDEHINLEATWRRTAKSSRFQAGDFLGLGISYYFC